MILLPILEGVCSGLVDTPETLLIEFTCTEDNDFYIINTSPGEEGQIIGKEGTIISALRLISRAIYTANKTNRKVFLDVNTNGTRKT